MQATPPFLSIFLLLLSNPRPSHGLCNLENGTAARCHELEDMKYVETHNLESLKASVADDVLHPGFFANLSSLRHLDLSGGDLKKVEAGSFRNLHDLKSLDLADNNIGYLELASLDGLNQLRSLNLRRNNLTQLPPVLARLKNLKHLDIQGNPFECNCATLRVRDLLTKRGVKLSKKVVCVSPNNLKGTSLPKPDAPIICALEEQDKEMQHDQPHEGSGDEPEDDGLDDYVDEYIDVPPTKKKVEAETPHPGSPETSSTVSSSIESPEPSDTTASTTTTNALPERSTEEDELFFDSTDEKKEQAASTTEMTKSPWKDSLFYPVEGGSGDGDGDGDDEGSGEGSGTEIDMWSRTDETHGATSAEPSTTSGDSLLDMLFGVFWSTTAAPEKKRDPDLEEEQFIDASSTKIPAEEEVVVPKRVQFDELVPKTSTTAEPATSTSSGVEVVDSSEVRDMSKSGKVKIEADSDELTEVSPARQSKKGMGSYVVLAALLAVLAALIGFAAYKGDFCRKKRKRNDVENGTELKDMQKALLDTGNSTQPKIASNGNAENVPLVEGSAEREDSKDTKSPGELPKSLNGTSDQADPVKPPRKLFGQPNDAELDEPRTDANSLKDDSLSTTRTTPTNVSAANNEPIRTATNDPDSNGPPLSPGAQRVKITLQENPDSVPRTPILITRTMAGENLVKTP